MTNDLPHAILAVDLIIFRLHQGVLETVLVVPKGKLHQGKFAFPGGLVRSDEGLMDAAIRYYLGVTKTLRRRPHLEQLATFGDLKRDPSGRVVSVAYLALVSPVVEIDRGQKLFPEAAWHAYKALPPLAYDHQTVAAQALDRLRSKLGYTNLICHLLPREFTLSELQEAYQIILGHHLDKRNFRKKIKTLKILKPLHRKRLGLTHRPALLYTFASSRPQTISVLK